MILLGLFPYTTNCFLYVFLIKKFIFVTNVWLVRPFPLGNHGLCPVFYNYAFSNIFAAVDKGDTCRQSKNDRDAINLPRNQTIRMGYFQNQLKSTKLNEVNLYAVTSRDPPFN